MITWTVQPVTSRNFIATLTINVIETTSYREERLIYVGF